MTPAPGHAGGIFFGPDEDNFARVAIVGGSNGSTALQFLVEVGGVDTEVARLDVTGTPLSNLDLFIVGDPSGHTLTAYYDLNVTGTMSPLGAATPVPASWFSSNLGAAGSSSLGGIMTSHGSAAQMAFGYDFFRIDRSVPAPPAGVTR